MRRRLPLWRTVTSLCAALALAAAAVLGFARVDRVVVAGGALRGGSHAVRAPFDGRVAELLVRQGQAVAAGEALLRLDTDALDSELAQVDARLLALAERAGALAGERRELEELEHPLARETARLEREKARVETEASARRVAALEGLREEGLVSALAFEDARTTLELARLRDVESALAFGALGAQHEARLAQLATAERELEGHTAEQRALRAELSRRRAAATVAAESAGIALVPPAAELRGARVAGGDELLRIATSTADSFEGRVGELGRPKVRAGLAVRLRVEGYPWLIHGSVPGCVEFLSERSDERGFPVEVALAPQAPGFTLYEGMRASARILVEERVPLWRLVFERMVEP